ncbi:unnamed protein product [Rotaria sp. Silwood2]|nr:unnamed protein product [Rotaria sp. Silwood2]
MIVETRFSFLYAAFLFLLQPSSSSSSSSSLLLLLLEKRPWPTSTLSRQLSNVESSISNTIINDNIENYNSYQRSLSIDNSTVDDLFIRTNRATSVEPNLPSNNSNDIKINNGHNHHYLCQQRSLPNGSTDSYDSTGTMDRQFTSSETIDQSIKSSPNIMMNSISSYDRTSDLQYNNFEENRLTTLRYFDARETNPNRTAMGFHLQSRVSSLKNDQQSSLDDPEYNPAFTIRRHLLHIIEERLKVTLPDDISYALSDGVVLCHFINQIRPRSVQSIHVPSQAVPKLSLAKCRRNVENFIEASRRIGIPEPCLVKLTDIIVPFDRSNSNELQQHGLFRLFLTINYLKLIALNTQELCENNLCSSIDKTIANFLLVFLALSIFLLTYYHYYL